MIEQMEDLLHAENQLVKALPKMAKASHSPQLRQCFTDHLEQTRGHVERLNQAFELLGAKAKAKTCKGMQGLIEEGEESVSEGKDYSPASADLALIIAAQKVEHYEISGYGSLRALADRLGETRVSRLLADNQNEEARADELLTEISQPLFAKAA
ncbi:MAG: ferritin-like domain-containing protein [Terriglobales bacterium]